jgi:hypothetical protein
MLSEDWKMCARARTPLLSHDWTSAHMPAIFGEQALASTQIISEDWKM